MKTQLIALFALLALSSCQYKGDKAKIIADPYVYYDSNLTMHIDEDCPLLKSDPKNVKVRYDKIEVFTDLKNGHKVYTCNKCVTNEIYNVILGIKQKPR